MLEAIIADARSRLKAAATGLAHHLARFPWEAGGDRMLRLL